MATALRASRDFLARALARVRAGAAAYERGLDTEGPAIKVEPFDAQNVSTPAALIKLGTSIAAAQRARANYRAGQEDVTLAREKTRAEIARLRAEAAYNLGQGRQTGGRAAATLSRDVGPYKAGTLLTDVNADMAERRLANQQRSEASRNRRAGRLSAAQAGLREIDARIGREAADRAAFRLGEYGPLFTRAAGGDPKALAQLEISPRDFAQSFDKAKLIASARNQIYNNFLRTSTTRVAKRYQAKRDEYQSIIDEGVGGFGEDTGVEGQDPNDPLGLGLNVGPDLEAP